MRLIGGGFVTTTRARARRPGNTRAYFSVRQHYARARGVPIWWPVGIAVNAPPNARAREASRPTFGPRDLSWARSWGP